MLRRIFRHAGGLRVDHVAGLWRLWWVPPGMGAAEGTYVHYDPEAMLGILALEAHRAGAVVVGEDLGTVLPVVTEGLERMNMLGSAVLWFTRDYDDPAAGLPAAPRDYPRNALASISTHDLPTAAGFLAGEQVRVRAELGQLAGTVEDEQQQRRRGPGPAARRAARGGPDHRRTAPTTRSWWRCTSSWRAPRAGSSPRRSTTCWASCASRTCPAPRTSIRTGGCRCATSLEQIVADPRVRRIAEVLSARKGTAA